MKVCLVFSPFSSFSYIPLGISYLKSFIEKKVLSVHVKNLDLSNNLYHNLDLDTFVSSLSSLCLICPRNKKSGCKGILLRRKKLSHWMKVALLCKGLITGSKTNEFYDVAKYNKLRKISDSFYGQIILCLDRILKHSLEHGQDKNNNILENLLFKDDINKILFEEPRVIGFSIFSQLQINYSLVLAKILKAKISPKIILGGAYISHLDKRKILRAFNFIDFIIYKEGEQGIVSLLRDLKRKRFNEVPNLVYRKGGKIIENKESVVYNLNEIPFPNFRDYNLKQYFSPQPVVSTLFSRGCFWGGCTFCAHHKTYSNPYRTRSIPNLTRELKRYQKSGIKHIWFTDEIISAANVDLINKALIKNKIKIYYGVMLRPTGDFTYNILKRMFKAGCRLIIWGVESFNQRILNLMNKGTNVKDIENVLEDSYKIGLSNLLYMIQGFPTQTEKEILNDRETLRKKSKYFYRVGIHNFWLEEDTAIFRNPKKFKLKYLKRKCLLKIKGSKLFSPQVTIIDKNKTRWARLSKLINSLPSKDAQTYKFIDRSLFYSKEHMLLHLTRQSKLIKNRATSFCFTDPKKDCLD